MGARKTTGLDPQRVWQLYQVKGTMVKDIAFSLNTTQEDVRAALSIHAASVRKIAIKEAISSMAERNERILFELTLPDLSADDSAWKSWLARSALKPR
jgi:hypothetical protein